MARTINKVERQGRDGPGDEVCAASRGIGFPIQSGGIRREFLGQPTYLKAKAEGDNSMSVKRLRPESVVEPVPHPRDTVKLDCLNPSSQMVNSAPAGRTFVTRRHPLHRYVLQTDAPPMSGQ